MFSFWKKLHKSPTEHIEDVMNKANDIADNTLKEEKLHPNTHKREQTTISREIIYEHRIYSISVFSASQNNGFKYRAMLNTVVIASCDEEAYGIGFKHFLEIQKQNPDLALLDMSVTAVSSSIIEDYNNIMAAKNIFSQKEKTLDTRSL